MHEGAGGGGEEGLFGRVAKIRGLRMQTFSHGNEGKSIDTFLRFYAKIYRKRTDRKGDGSMKAKMMRAKLKNQFAAVFAVAPVFPFLMC